MKIRFCKSPSELIQIRKGLCLQLCEIRFDFHRIEPILLVQQPVKRHGKLQALPICFGNFRDTAQYLIQFLFLDGNTIFRKPDAALSNLGHHTVDAVDIGALGIDLLKDIGRHIRFEAILVTGFPEVQRGFHKSDNQIAAFHMALFSQIVDEDISSVGQFINSR